jgi:nucleoside-diphosphate-sugar epimerase
VELSGKRALVTGGAGFVGSHIVDQLVDAGCARIVVIDNLVRGSRENLAGVMNCGRVKLVDADIRDRTLMNELVQSADIVFHQAALRITHCAAEPQHAFDVMIKATFDLVQMCVAHNVQKMVVASSASIYGMAEHFPTGESEPPYANRTLYGAAKLFAEGLLRAFNEMTGLDYVALRYFNVYGPRMDRHGKYTEVLIRWMERIEAGMSPLVFGDGDETMDMINVRDVARANILAASAPVTDVVVNIGSGEEISLYELATRLARVMGREDLSPELRPRRAVNPVPRRLADIAAARRCLGFRPTIGFDEGLSQLVAWWRQERQQNAALATGRGA